MNTTEQLMITTLIMRKERPAPERCPICKSYRVVLDFRSELMNKTDNPYIKLCESCGWEEEKKQNLIKG